MDGLADLDTGARRHVHDDRSQLARTIGRQTDMRSFACMRIKKI
jgi:hypothetical protein